MYAKPMMLNEKLGEQLPLHFEESVQVTELYGIEVELEGKGGIANPTEKIMENWVKHNDGSLRKLNPGDEAVEYVSRVPRNKIKTTKALMDLIEFLTGPNKVVYDSYRTSIHVHVNCMADKMIHVYNFITLCIIFDELLASQNGEHRIGNNFCLRARDAEGQIADLIGSINAHGSIFGLNGQWRYSAINFASLCKFGTVEFRSLECTTDLKRIVDWVQVIDNLKEASRQFENPHQIIRGFSQSFSVQDFCKKILGNSAQKYIEVPGYDRMLFEGMRLAQDFAFCSKWVAKEPKAKAQPQAKAKKLYFDLEAGAPWPDMQPAPQPAPPGGAIWQQFYAQDAQAMAAAHAELNNLAAQPMAPQPMLDDDDDDDFDDDDFFEDFHEDDEEV